MNNLELVNWLHSITQGNSFDVYEALIDKNNIKFYKTSNFYKQTKMPLRKAYVVFSTNGLLNIVKLLQSDLVQECSSGNWSYIIVLLEKIITDFDPSVLDNILNYIAESIMNIDVVSLQEKLESSLKEMKQINIKF